MKELFKDFKESFSHPKSFRDIHLVVFILQVIILFLFSLGIYYLAAEDEPSLITDKGLISSYISSFSSEMADKTFVELPSLIEDEDHIVKTDKFLDIKNGGVWLSQKQEYGIVSTFFALIPSAIAYLLLGIGRMFKRLRDPYFSALGKTAALLIIPPLGVAVWGAISIFFWFAVCTALYVLGPLMYLIHLILGIIQLSRLIKGKKA
ncbi:hypothetical protein [Ruminococcus sp.]|uniref:hypothetical protein n=1 Tax=Ruminococcus sp. TaxID=41978 RepID=UPI0025FEAFAC|nr:hypothetical protein [Ruminococcus sp.]